MRKWLGLLILLLLIPLGVQAEEWRDPFACDPYTFVFDFPLIQKSPYDSLRYTMLVRSASVEDQEITVSMWPDYLEVPDPSSVADSSWFTFAPENSPLPTGGVAAFNILCKPPYQTLEEKEYTTFIRVARTVGGEQYWDRPLGVKVRIGSAVPRVDYSIEGWKRCQIVGEERTAYTQDQILINVSNRGYTLNEFCMYPVDAQEPSETTPDPDTVGDFREFQAQWRDPDALSVKVEPVGDQNETTKEYDEYRLYTDDGEFGTFLSASYDRAKDEMTEKVYPYRIAPTKSAGVPFVLRVNKDVPTGIYRLQIHVEPSGISVESRSGGINIEYESKIVLVVTRTSSGASGSSVWLFGSLCVAGIALAGWWGFNALRRPTQRARA